MKAVLMSIRPQWAEKIFNGSKSIEVRKSHPSIPTPFKAYVYCTKTGMGLYGDGNHYITDITNFLKGDAAEGFEKTSGLHKWNGKVIGSFVCDRIDDIEPCSEYYSNGYDIDDDILTKTCLTQEQLREYGKGKTLYGWHITEPKLFEKPREIEKFIRGCDDMLDPQFGSYCGYCPQPCFLKRPPQSWCYIETGEYSKRGGKE